MWWNNKQGAERSRREERLNLLPASQEMRHDVGVWSTHPSRTIPPPPSKVVFPHTHTHMHKVLLAKVPTIHCGSRSPESSLALSRCTSALTLFFLMSPWWIKYCGNRTYFHACSLFFNKDRGFNFSIVAKLTRRLPNGDVGSFLESSPHLPQNIV